MALPFAVRSLTEPALLWFPPRFGMVMEDRPTELSCPFLFDTNENFKYNVPLHRPGKLDLLFLISQFQDLGAGDQSLFMRYWSCVQNWLYYYI